MFKKILLIAVLVLYSLPGCTASTGEEEAMYQLASPLTKLSATVESAVRYKNADPRLRDGELLEFATRHDPRLLAPFAGYQLRARVDGRHGVVMVCTREGDRGLLEDAGCTAKLDRHLWQEAQPCRFTLAASRVCPSR